MARRARRDRDARPGPSGFLVVDKPPGWTSHDVVDAARRWLGTRRVGHLGTLDPAATGVLPLAVRDATKLVPFLEAGRKGYAGTIRLGAETDTLDAEGEVLRRYEGALPDEAQVRAALPGFFGDIEQVPPMYSAVKRDGVPLHRLARAGKQVERKPKSVCIDRLELLKYTPPDLEILVECSAGTYVRVLAEDLGRELGCGAHLAGLRRTRSGPFLEEHAVSEPVLRRASDEGEIDAMVSPAVNALEYPVVRLTPEEVGQVRHGSQVLAPETPLTPGTRVAALDPSGVLLAVLEVRPGRRMHPLRVLSVAPPG
ncbi:MAG: tRNA pseudouridine(55) synthase TruB [Deltaproteobacteria bacterium]|nr:tRNA pseudouridine(55) synthase TruB [Deltaproteobacteria bacterium]